MSDVAFDHFTVHIDDTNRTERVFTEILGLQRGPRPPFSFPGVWLYQGKRAVVHLVEESTGGDAKATEAAGAGTGVVGHIAFRADDYETMRNRLTSDDWPFREATVPGLNLRQLFVRLPGNLIIEIAYPAQAAGADEANGQAPARF